METLAGQSICMSFRASISITSHEALLLYYEQAQTRQVPRSDGWFNLSTHFPWIGMRTAELGGRACRILPRHPQPGRREGRAGDER